MEEARYWAIAERDMEIQNPITDRKLRLLDAYCDIRDGLRVLDVGCGKAWLMRQWAQRFAIDGVGLETNVEFLDFARRRPPAHGRIGYVEGPAADYRPEPESFDVAMCLGATFALGGFVGAMDWLAAAVRPGGAVVIGDLTLKHEPAFRSIDEVLPLTAIDTMAVVERHGAELAAVISASDADYERYVSHHRHATLRWATEHADHPDHEAVLARSRRDWTHYLRVERPYLGWAIFVGLKV